MKCPDCNGTGYQPLQGCPGAQGGCLSCADAASAAINEAARIIIGGFAGPEDRYNSGFIAEAARIIHREIRDAGLQVVRVS